MNASCAEFRDLRPEHVELRRRQAFAVDVAADGDAARAEPLDGVLEHVGRELRELQRNRRHPDEAVGMLLAPRASVSLCLLQIAVASPWSLMSHHQKSLTLIGFDVDADLVHHRDAVVEPGARRAILFVRRALDDVAERHVPVAVHVNHLDALAGDADLQPCRRGLGEHRLRTPRNVKTGGRSGDRLEELSPIRHGNLLVFRRVRLRMASGARRDPALRP